MSFAQAMTIAARSYLVQGLEDCGGNVRELCRRAGLKPDVMYDLFHELGLKADDYRPRVREKIERGNRFKEWAGAKWGSMVHAGRPRGR